MDSILYPIYGTTLDSLNLSNSYLALANVLSGHRSLERATMTFIYSVYMLLFKCTQEFAQKRFVLQLHFLFDCRRALFADLLLGFNLHY